MSLLVVGVSHRTAPMSVLERVTVSAADTAKVLDDLLTGDHVSEAMVVSTCNRVEVYAVVETFHGGLTEVSGTMARHAHAEVSDLTEHFYVHYAASAVEHLFSVAAGLDSMVVGEAQILGQLRAAYGQARDLGTAGRVLHEVGQHALRVGKRAQTETGVDAVGASVVSEALDEAAPVLGGLAGRRALVVGAGSMGSLAAAHLRRAGAGEIVVANRSADRAERLAASLATDGTPARAVGLDAVGLELGRAEVVVVCTGAVGTVLGAATVAAARAEVGAPLVVCDLGLPHDVEPDVARLAGVTLIDLDTLGDRMRGGAVGDAVAQARELVAHEVRSYLAAQRTAEVTPTVTALRRRAAEVVDAELLRLDGRMPDLDGDTRGELAQTVHRVVDKLLHTPTVQVKRLAQAPGGDSYAEALRELFELDPQTPAAVTAAPAAGTDGALSAEGEAVEGALAVDLGAVDGAAATAPSGGSTG